MRRTSRLIGILSGIAVLMVSVCAAVSVAQEEPLRAHLQTKFENALTLYNAGQYDEAAQALDEILAMQPTAHEALILREKAGMEVLIKMLRDPKLGPAARMILRQAEKEAAAIQRDPATIKAEIERMGADDVVERWAAIHKLVAIGPYAVPYVLEYALTEDLPELGSRKVSAVIVLQNMSSRAVPPLTTAMMNTNPKDAARIAALLAKLPDARAVPPLLALKQDPARPEFLRNAAATALEAIASDVSDSAAQSYYLLGQRYYYNDPSLIELAPTVERVLWRWNAEGGVYSEKLTYMNVPEAAYARLLAQDVILDGMKQAHDSLDLIELYVSNNYMQFAEASEGVTEAQRMENLRTVHAVNEALGREALYRSLGRALRDDNLVLARLTIEALRRVGDARAPETNTLVEAVNYPEKVVRVSAAETLMHLSPLGELGGTESSVSVIGAGLGAPVRRRIAFISRDESLLVRWSQALTNAGMIPLTYQDLTDAAMRVKKGVPPVSAVLVDTRMKGALVIARSFRQDARSSDVPVIIIGQERDMNLLREDLGAGIIAVLPVNAEADAVVQTVSSGALEAQSLATQDIRENLAMVKRILATLSTLPGNTAYPAHELSVLIADLLRGTDAEVRTLALKAIANLPDATLLDTVFGIFANGEESDAIREEAGRALLSVLPVSPRLTDQQKATLIAMSQDGESVLRWQAIHALSAADLPLAERESRLPELGLPAQL
jgi:hypothetical protein